MEQIIHNNLIRPLQAHTARSAFALAKKEILRHHIAIPMSKHQRPPAIAKRIPAKNIAIGLHRNNLRLSTTTLKKIVLNHRLTIARLRIVRIPLRNKLKRLVPIALLTIRNIDKIIVVNTVSLALIPNVNLHQLTAAHLLEIIGLILKSAAINLNLPALRPHPYPLANLNIRHHTTTYATTPPPNLHTPLLHKMKPHKTDIIPHHQQRRLYNRPPHILSPNNNRLIRSPSRREPAPLTIIHAIGQLNHIARLRLSHPRFDFRQRLHLNFPVLTHD